MQECFPDIKFSFNYLVADCKKIISLLTPEYIINEIENQLEISSSSELHRRRDVAAHSESASERYYNPEVQIYCQPLRNFLWAYFDKLPPRLIPFAYFPSTSPSYHPAHCFADSTELFWKLPRFYARSWLCHPSWNPFMLFKSSLGAFEEAHWNFFSWSPSFRVDRSCFSDRLRGFPTLSFNSLGSPFFRLINAVSFLTDSQQPASDCSSTFSSPFCFLNFRSFPCIPHVQRFPPATNAPHFKVDYTFSGALADEESSNIHRSAASIFRHSAKSVFELGRRSIVNCNWGLRREYILYQVC